MASLIEPVEFLFPGSGQRISLPPPWTSDAPEWLREMGRTKVIVIDDQVQSLADLSDEDALRERICEPLNVEFVFCPECADGHPLAKGGKWFDAVAARIEEMKGSLAAVFLDIMFTGETDPLEGSGIAFLSRIRKIVQGLPVLIMTQARDERRLHERIAEAGLHLDFLQKDSGGRVDALCRFLCEHGWVADPTFNAFSQAMRDGVAGLRHYAIKRPRIDRPQGNYAFGDRQAEAFDMPKPLLILAPSGEGKTRTAEIAARWLMHVTPRVCTSRMIEVLDCNTLQRDQGAKIALFGRGPQDAQRERADAATGLVVRGKAQRAADGILIVDELGNSDQELQEMLLAFVESGRTEPEFRNDRMTRAALGPLRVLCIFTAQLRHIEQKRIIEDIDRRIRRGLVIDVPPLPKRLEEVVPIFYEKLKTYRRNQDAEWQEPGDINDLIPPASQAWLREVVAEFGLSASALADLVGEPSEAVKVIGVPYLEHRLENRFKAKPLSRPPVQTEEVRLRNAAPAVSLERPALDQFDPIELVEKLAEMKHLRFPRDKKDELEGYLSRVQAAAANLILPYLEACLDIARGAKSELNVVGTYKFVSGEHDIKKTTAATRLKELLLVSKDSTLDALRTSELLAGLAIAVADRSKEVQQLLDELACEPSQQERLRRLGWNVKGTAQHGSE